MPDSELSRLLDIMARLRDPLTGCPWDQVQTFESIAPYTIEEVYEVVEAIEAGDWEQLRDELGDLFFQVVYHARMAEEAGYFDFSQVLRSIADKLVRRHPHVFGDENIDDLDAAGQKRRWEAMKVVERGQKQGHSLMDDIPVALPAMERALKIQKRAALAGFDWQDSKPVIDKVAEEIEEMRAEIHSGNQAALEAETGDLLFAVINLARHLGVDPVAALRQSNRKFTRRFRAMEKAVGEQAFRDMDIEAQEKLWQKVKENEQD